MAYDHLHRTCGDAALRAHHQALGLLLLRESCNGQRRCNIDALLQTSVQGGLSGLILSWANELTGSDSESKFSCTRRSRIDSHLRHRTLFCGCLLQHVRLCLPGVATHVGIVTSCKQQYPSSLTPRLQRHLPTS